MSVDDAIQGWIEKATGAQLEAKLVDLENPVIAGGRDNEMKHKLAARIRAEIANRQACAGALTMGLV